MSEACKPKRKLSSSGGKQDSAFWPSIKLLSVLLKNLKKGTLCQFTRDLAESIYVTVPGDWFLYQFSRGCSAAAPKPTKRRFAIVPVSFLLGRNRQSNLHFKSITLKATGNNAIRRATLETRVMAKNLLRKIEEIETNSESENSDNDFQFEDQVVDLQKNTNGEIDFTDIDKI